MTPSNSNHDPRKRKVSPDSLLDSLLSEMLNETALPNYAPQHEKFVAAAREGHRLHGLFTPEELQASADRAWRDTQFDAVTPAISKSSRISPVLRPSSQTPVEETPRGVWHRNNILLVAIAASMIGILLTCVFLQRRGASDRIAKTKRAFPKLGSGNDNLFPSPAVPIDGVASNQTVIPPSAESGPTAPVPTPAPTNALSSQLAAQGTANPSDTQIASQTPASNPRTTNESTTERNPSRLGQNDDRDTIAVINDQLQHLWKRVGLSGGKQVDLAQVEDRLAQLLVGRLPTSTEREWARKAGLGAMDTAQLLAIRWIESEEFDRHWAGVLTEYYLDPTLDENPNEPRQRFTDWLQESLRVNRSIASLERALLATDSAAQQPESYWWTHWSTQGQTHGIGRRSAPEWAPVGYAEEAKASLDAVSLQVLRMSGRSEATCAQCHTDRPASLSSTSAQDVGGSLADAFQGTAALVASLLDPLKKDFYTADPEGKVSLIAPRLPNGLTMEEGIDRRQALGAWVEGSERARAPFVDFVWYRALGQPLLPQVGLDEEEGLDERRDLLEFLARQTQTSEASVRQLVFWIAMSAPMAMESSELNAAAFLKLDEKGLADHQRGKRMFARFAGKPRSTGSASRLGSLAQWLSPSSDTSSQNGLLAQPSATVPFPGIPAAGIPAAGSGDIDSLSIKQESLALNPSGWSAERVEFEATDAVPYHRARDFAAALAISGLEWDAVVDHSFLMCVSRYPTKEERKQAADLLEWSRGDRKIASTRLINALLGQL